MGGIPFSLPPLTEEQAGIAASDAAETWKSLVEIAVRDADALILTGSLFDPAADLRAERALTRGLERLAAEGVTVLA
ncbi:MAG: hypothetical protein AAF907_03115, partial [Planctomycetota bacterium]